jgi:hypothetical protein
VDVAGVEVEVEVEVDSFPSSVGFAMPIRSASELEDIRFSETAEYFVNESTNEDFVSHDEYAENLGFSLSVINVCSLLVVVSLLTVGSVVESRFVMVSFAVTGLVIEVPSFVPFPISFSTVADAASLFGGEVINGAASSVVKSVDVLEGRETPCCVDISSATGFNASPADSGFLLSSEKLLLLSVFAPFVVPTRKNFSSVAVRKCLLRRSAAPARRIIAKV